MMPKNVERRPHLAQGESGTSQSLSSSLSVAQPTSLVQLLSKSQLHTQRGGVNATAACEQAHMRAHPCRPCSRYDQMPHSRCERCAGFISEDEEWEHCERVEGVLLPTASTPHLDVRPLGGGRA
jgi:hypothetical protein